MTSITFMQSLEYFDTLKLKEDPTSYSHEVDLLEHAMSTLQDINHIKIEKSLTSHELMMLSK